MLCLFFFFQAEDGIRDLTVTGVQTCALPIYHRRRAAYDPCAVSQSAAMGPATAGCRQLPRPGTRSEEHTSELQSQSNLVCRLLLEKKKKANTTQHSYTLRVSHHNSCCKSLTH